MALLIHLNTTVQVSPQTSFASYVREWPKQKGKKKANNEYVVRVFCKTMEVPEHVGSRHGPNGGGRAQKKKYPRFPNTVTTIVMLMETKPVQHQHLLPPMRLHIMSTAIYLQLDQN